MYFCRYIIKIILAACYTHYSIRKYIHINILNNIDFKHVKY